MVSTRRKGAEKPKLEGDTGDQLLDAAVKLPPTLDIFLDRNPKTLKWPSDYIAMAKVLQERRAMFIKADETKKEKKELKE